MPVDSVRAYLTGATADGVAQPDCVDSDGGFRSSTLASSMTVHRYSALRGIQINFVAGLNGVGNGNLLAVSASELTWTPPNGTAGDAVTIAYGETQTLYGGGDDADKYIIVTRTTTYVLAGSENVQLLDTVNNVTGGINFDSDESTAGANHPVAVMFKNHSSLSVTDLKAWVDSDYNTSVEIAAETPTSDELLGSGLSYSTPTTEGTALNLGTVAASGLMGLWIKQVVAASTAADPLVRTVIHYKFTLDGETYYGAHRGINRIADADETYELYIGEDTDPAIDGSPDQTFTSFPYDADALDAGHVYYHQVVRLNQWGLRSPVSDDAWLARCDGSATPPIAPQIVEAYPRGDGKIYVSAGYISAGEGLTAAARDLVQADTWLIYVSDDGDDPDTGTDTPETEAMSGRGFAKLGWTSTDAYLEGQPIRVAVAARRVDTGPVNVDSDLSDVATVSAEWFGPLHPDVSLSAGKAYGMYAAPPSYAGATVYVDEGNNIRWVLTPGESVLWGDSVKIWTIKYDSTGGGLATNGFYPEFGILTNTISGTGTTDAIEVGSWTAGDKHLFVNVRGERCMKIDVTNETIECAQMGSLDDMTTTRANVPAWCHWLATCFQVWDPGVAEWATAVALDTNGNLNSIVGIR